MSSKMVVRSTLKQTFISYAVGVVLALPTISIASQDEVLNLPPQYAPVAAGESHSLVRCENGLVFTWGSNASGQLGDGTGLDAYNPVSLRDEHYEPVDGLSAVASGANHSLALKLDGGVVAWGSNDANQVFDASANIPYSDFYISSPDAYTGPFKTAPAGGETNSFETPVTVIEADSEPATQVRAVASYGSLSVALRADGSVIAWGDTGFLKPSSDAQSANSDQSLSDTTSNSNTTETNDSGNAGDGSGDATQQAESSVVVLSGVDGEPVTGVISIAAGEQHIVGRLPDGRALIWDASFPTDPALLREGGERAAFAQNNQSPEDDSPYFDPSKLVGEQILSLRATYVRDLTKRIVRGIRQISAAADYSIFVLNNGQVMALGNTTIPFFTNGSSTTISTETSTTDTSNTDSSSTASNNGTSTTESSVSSEAVSNADSLADYIRRNDGNRLTEVRAAAAGSDHALFLLNSSHVAAMGANDSGQLGDGSNSATVDGSALVTVVDDAGEPIKHIAAIAAGDRHSLALSREGAVFAWGDGSSGQLGDGSNVSSFSAVSVRDSFNRQFSTRYSCEPLF